MASNSSHEKKDENGFNYEEKRYLDQLLNFVDFKENVSYISEKASDIKREIWSDVEIGYSLNECESLLEQQNQLELKCADMYSFFSVLRQQAAEEVQKKNFLSRHYRKSCILMENVCYTLASDLVTRRNLITSSAKFHSFLFQFRSEIEDVKSFVAAFGEIDSFDIDMDFILKKIHIFVDQICSLVGAVVSQGVQLFDILTKVKVPQKVQEVHRQHVGGWIAFAEVEKEFRLQKLDQLMLRIQMLWQLKRSDKGVKQSIQWLQELISVIISRCNEVGETAVEADSLFLQLIQHKDAAKESYEIGLKLLESSAELNQELGCDNYDSDLSKELREIWIQFSNAFKRVAERLDLSQNFYRSIEKQMKKTKELDAVLQSKLKIFGEVRRSFVIHHYKKSWRRIRTEIQKSLQTGRLLLDALKRPIAPNHIVNLLSSSAAIKIVQTMSDAEKTAQQMQGSYFNDDSTTEEYVSARSPDTWKSTSISGVEDWWSVGSGTTLDDFKSIEDDVAEEYMSEDSAEDLPSSSTPVPQELKNDDETKEYAAVVGIQESKGQKFTTNIQPGVSVMPPNVSGIPHLSTVGATSITDTQAIPGASYEQELIAVSPKQSLSFEPPKYSSVITKTESKDVKTEMKTSYAIQTHIKAGGVDQTLTSHKSENIQLLETTPESKVEKIHKIIVMDEPQLETKKSEMDNFPTGLATGGESKAKLFSELEDLKSKIFAGVSETSGHTDSKKTESKSENVSYGFSAFPSSSKDGDGRTTDVSRVVYAKEVTESHSSTSISFQQQSFGGNRSEKWQSVTPQAKPVPTMAEIKKTYQAKLMEEKFQKLEKNISESKEWIQLKIQEMQPAMTDIGTNLAEATALYQQHEKVLEKLQTKQSPVEELLRQADDLISNQKPRGEVYSAMAENLGLAWKDLNAQLEQRRQILEQAVAFFSKSEQLAESLELIKKSVHETFLPDTVESTTTMISRHKEERKTALSNSMRMLSEGKLLLEKLCEVATHSMGDSRPAHMQHAARKTSSFVERHMEALQDRWRHLESLWNQKKTQLEQCLLKCQMEIQMKEAETWFRTKGCDYLMERNLGDSLASSEILQHEHHKIENECKEKQDFCLKIVKSAEELHRKGNYAGEELQTRSYRLLSESADLIAAMELRRLLLADSIHFFNEAQTALTKLDQIEIQLTTSDIPTSSNKVEEIANLAIQDGRKILSTTGMTEPGAQGIIRKIEELEAKKSKLYTMCKAKEMVASEKSQAFKKFCEKYDELVRWLSNSGLFFVQRARDMGTTQTSAKTFIEQHESMQNDLRMKTIDVEALLRSVPNLVRTGGEEAEIVHNKSEDIKQQFSQLRNALEKRLHIAQKYLAFLKLSSKVTKEMDEFETHIKQAIEVPNQDKFRNIEEKQITLRQEILQANNSGRNFLEDARKADDMHLNMGPPCATVEDILSRLELRNVTLTTQWLNFQNEISATKETLIQWEIIIKESNKVMKNVQDLECKMFPAIPYELNKIDSILPFLENRMSVLLPQIKSVQKEMDGFLKKSQSLSPLDDSQREARQTMEKLKSVHHGLQKKLTDYQILISMMTSFFKNFEELEKLIDMQESQYRMNALPNDVSKMENLIHDHESNKPSVMELFKFSNTEAQTLINKINEAEPPQAATSDKEKISTIHNSRKLSFERAWDDHKYKLEQHNQLCIFNRDMHLINQQIEDLNNHLASIRQSFGESLPSVVHTSEAYLQFEKTIELLQIRIYEFISTAETMMRDQRVDSSRINQEIQTMQRKWSTFRTEVTTSRMLIDVAIEYYKTIEEAEEWLKEGSRLLISVARKSSTCANESDAENLKKEVQEFMNRGRHQQEERLRKISSLSIQLYGSQVHPPTEVIAGKNRDMMESFSSISTELTTLTSNIRISQQTKIKEQKEKKEIDAALHAAQAEAEAAKAAAAAAQQAAKLAEAAMKAIPPEPAQRPPRFIRQLTDAEINEGTKFTFECQVDGYPMPQVQWFKEGILVENNPDYQTTMENGFCRLTIEETFSEDTAKFICRATNPAGVAETQCQLIVKEAHPQNELIPPHFVQEPKDSAVSEGESHHLECQVFGNPLPLVSWFKDDNCIDYSTDYAITYNNGFCTLKIDEAHALHQGRYTCRATNPVGQVACSANLLVSSSLPYERPAIVVPLSNVMARAGQKLRLECTISGQPEPQMTWLHNSKALKETRDCKIHFDGRNATLVITEAFPKDAGTYTIIARNKAGEAVSSCNVSVKGRLPLETSDSEIASDIEPAKPQVRQQLVDQNVLEGNRVRMDCVIVGQPEPEVIWYHNGKPVKESNDFQLLFEGDRCTLIIKTAYLEDGGTYKCVAINSGGEASSICQLKIEPVTDVVQKSEFSQKDILISVEKIEPPRFLKLLEGSSVIEGQEVILECQVVAEPKATITWYKDGVQLMSNPQNQIQIDDSGYSRLRMPCVQIQDRGTFSVRAQNKGGEAQSFCTLVVSPPVNLVQRQPQIPPSFLQHVENQILQTGGTAKFETLVDGTPTPQVRWNFQGKPVPRDKHHKIGSDGNRHWLIIENVGKVHNGRYSAIAENDAGIATTSAVLNVQEPAPVFPVPPSVNTLEQRAQSMVMTKKKTMMQTSTISSMPEVSDIDFQPPEFPSFSSLQSQQLVKMEQTVTSTAPHFSPVPLEPLPPPSVAPKFIRPVSTAIVTEGEKLFLEAKYEGSPEPTIQWFKDDVELRNRPGLTLSTPGGGITSAFIMKSVESDGGKYKCIASNIAGKATSIAEAKVKPYRESPKFKKKLEASLVRSGSKVLLQVEVTGVPVPEVKWFRNGGLLQDSPDCRISSSGNTHTLLINEVFPDDSGCYMVVASNVAGEARSIADLVVEEEKSPDEEKVVTYQEFSSVQQKKEICTKISMHQAPSLKPYDLPTEVKKAIEPEPAKVPSPPPIPAIASKVWDLPKPERFPAPAITEAPEPIQIPSPEPEKEILPPVEKLLEREIVPVVEPVSFQPIPVVQPVSFQPVIPVEVPRHFPSSAPVTSAMSESIVKQSIMKFSHPDTKQEAKAEEKKMTVTSKSSVQQPVVLNGFATDSKITSESFSSMKQSTFMSESKSVVTQGSSTSPAKPSQVPVPTKFSPKPIVQPVQKEKEKPAPSLVPVWKPKKEAEPKPTWRKVQVPQQTSSTVTKSSLESKFSSSGTTDIPPTVTQSTFENKISLTGIPQTSESQFSATETKNTSAASSQTTTSSIPSSFYSTESSTTTRTSYSTEEISISKKYEMVLEHTTETISSSSDSGRKTITPKPIIKKEVKEGPKTKKEVVIEEEPVVGAEVKPPHFSKVRGAESLRKIYTDS